MLRHSYRLLDHRLREEATYAGGDYRHSGSLAAATGGLPIAARIERAAIPVLRRLDGRRALADAVDDTAREGAVDAELVRTAAIASIGRLLELGLAAPA